MRRQNVVGAIGAAIVSFLLVGIYACDSRANEFSGPAADSLLIVVNDPSRERRSYFDVADLNSGRSDFIVTIPCAANMCRLAAPNIFRRLDPMVTYNSSCAMPNYGKLEFIQKSRIVSTIYIDRTGKCISVDGKNFRLPRSLLDFLVTVPLKDW
jgi:hypothetical protein